VPAIFAYKARVADVLGFTVMLDYRINKLALTVEADFPFVVSESFVWHNFPPCHAYRLPEKFRACQVKDRRWERLGEPITPKSDLGMIKGCPGGVSAPPRLGGWRLN
jgi:hypothetical protein